MRVIKIASTIKDVSRLTGLSIATISKFINGGNVLDKNKIQIEKAINELEFKVNEIARGLKTNKTRTIGVLIPDLKSNFFTTIVSNIENILIQNGYSTIICDYKRNLELEKMKFNFLVNKMVDGIITVPFDGKDTKAIEGVILKGIPIVIVDRAIEGLNCDMVLSDNMNASYDAVENLIVKGHKRIGIISGPDDIFISGDRLKGYLRVHKDYSIKIDDNLIKKGDYEFESGYNLLNELMDSENPPTAVFVTNYDMTLGTLMAINDRNIKIPDELSFIGFDNEQIAKIVKPRLTTVVQPMQLIGETAANILLKRISGDMSNHPTLFRLKTSLMIGESTCELIA